MKDVSILLSEIDSIHIGNDFPKLKLKIEKINSLLDYIVSSDEILKDVGPAALDRVLWLSIEMGSSKAFESSAMDKEIVQRGLSIAKVVYENDIANLEKFENLHRLS